MFSFPGRSLILWSTIVLAFAPLVARAAFVSDVNGLLVDAAVVNGYPGSTLTITNNYPSSAIIDDSNLGALVPGGFANRSDLLFSSNGGASARTFNTQDSFDVSVNLTLDATFNLKRKEAGLRINRNGFDGQFIVNSDAHEIAAFGGPLPFYSFNVSQSISYAVGTPITLRMIYNAPVGTPTLGKFAGDYNDNGSVDAADYTVWRDHLSQTSPTYTLPNEAATTGIVNQADYDSWKANFGQHAGTIEYLVKYGGNDYTSGQIRFGNNETGTLASSQLGVYAQGGAEAAHPDDDYRATFTNFVWGNGIVTGAGSGSLTNGAVPEPTSIVLGLIGAVGILSLARRHR
jgi:hypothetical protein